MLRRYFVLMHFQYKKTICLITSIALSLALFSGCRTGTGTQSESSVSSSYPAETPSLPESSSDEDTLPAGNLSDWNLILLNPEPENKIDEDPDVEMTSFDGQQIDARAGEAYAAMRDAAAADGINLYLRSGFRKISLQKTYYDSHIQSYMQQGKSEEEAIRLTRQYYTEPGHSEHHSGLALDIITVEYQRDVYSLTEQFAETDGYRWLIAHCAEFGFILRYPKGKTDITQINYEPWHYRYVGKEHAQYIMEHDLTLEEYIALLKEAGR